MLAEKFENEKAVKQTLIHFLKLRDELLAIKIIEEGDFCIYESGTDYWNGNEYTYYDLDIHISPLMYSEYLDFIENIEKAILYVLGIVFKGSENESIVKVRVLTKLLQTTTVSTSLKDEIVDIINKIKTIMISVATGGPRINTQNDEYVNLSSNLKEMLHSANIKDPNTFTDLWQWYGRWSAGDLPSWQSRRIFISNLYADLLNALNNKGSSEAIDEYINTELTGWKKVDRMVGELKSSLEKATDEEHFQIVGLLSRELLIELGKTIYIAEKHREYLDCDPSSTDAVRMIDGYIQYNFKGSSNENIRKFIKTSNALANELTHKQTADYTSAALCMTSVLSIISIISIFSEKK